MHHVGNAYVRARAPIYSYRPSGMLMIVMSRFDIFARRINVSLKYMCVRTKFLEKITSCHYIFVNKHCHQLVLEYHRQPRQLQF